MNSREKKLSITTRIAATNTKFGITKGCLYQWLKNEKQTYEGSKGRKRVEGGGRKPFLPDLEDAKFTELHMKGIKVKHYWFLA